MLTKPEKIDVLKFMSKTHRNIHELRIKHELKVVITTLSFYAACVAFKLTEKMPGKNLGFIICLAIIAIAIFVCIYVKTSGQSNKINQDIAEEAEKKLLKLSEYSDIYDNIKNCHPSEKRGLWYVSIVSCGAIISSIMITYPLIECFFTSIIDCLSKPL